MLLTRREFLRASAGAGALLGIGATGLSSCTQSSGGRIVKVAVHPAIGVARVGNSADSFYFGPEVPDALPRPSGGFKDTSGALARQAARFRLYGTDEHGKVRELTADDGEITWTV